MISLEDRFWLLQIIFEMKWYNLKGRYNRFIEVELSKSINIFETLESCCQIFYKVLFLTNLFPLSSELKVILLLHAFQFSVLRFYANLC